MEPTLVASALKAPIECVGVAVPLLQKALDKEGILSVWTEIAAYATIQVECPPWKPIREYSPKGRNRAEYFESMYGFETERGKRLGNTEPGDGLKYCGAGYIQLTGKKNFLLAGEHIKVDLINAPEKALEPEIACAIFAWFFQSNHVDKAADSMDWKKVRRIVNGGFNALPEFVKAVGSLLSAQGLAGGI